MQNLSSQGAGWQTTSNVPSNEIQNYIMNERIGRQESAVTKMDEKLDKLIQCLPSNGNNSMAGGALNLNRGLFAGRGRASLVCGYCGKNGHDEPTCWAKNGMPPWKQQQVPLQPQQMAAQQQQQLALQPQQAAQVQPVVQPDADPTAQAFERLMQLMESRSAPTTPKQTTVDVVEIVDESASKKAAKEKKKEETKAMQAAVDKEVTKKLAKMRSEINSEMGGLVASEVTRQVSEQVEAFVETAIEERLGEAQKRYEALLEKTEKKLGGEIARLGTNVQKILSQVGQCTSVVQETYTKSEKLTGILDGEIAKLNKVTRDMVSEMKKVGLQVGANSAKIPRLELQVQQTKERLTRMGFARMTADGEVAAVVQQPADAARAVPADEAPGDEEAAAAAEVQRQLEETEEYAQVGVPDEAVEADDDGAGVLPQRKRRARSVSGATPRAAAGKRSRA